jgi:hypothetical protein
MRCARLVLLLLATLVAVGCSKWETQDPSGADTTMLYDRDHMDGEEEAEVRP